MLRPIKKGVPEKPGYMIIEHLCGGRWAKKIALIFVMGFAMCIGTVLAQDPARKDLKNFYQQNCAKCHGPDGSAVSADGKRLKGRDFTDQDWQHNARDDSMVQTILKGKFFGLAMPKFKGALTEEEALRIVTDIIRKSKKGQVIAPEVEDRPGK